MSSWVLPLGLFVFLEAFLGFWGVNIEDGGLILAQSRRILFGEVPHVDFITPRPTGSAFLHLLDFALPIPLILASKIVTLAEFVAIGVFFSLFVYRKRLGDLSFPEAVGVVVAVLVGIHQFPIIPFYTIDGLALVGAAFLLLQRGVHSRRLAHIAPAFGLLGVAATTKQSFWFAPFFAFAWLVASFHRQHAPPRQLARAALAAVGACAAAPAAYVAYVAIGGGWAEMRAELTQTTPVWGDILLSQLRNPDLRSHLLPSLLVLMVAAALVQLAPVRLPAAIDVGARVVATIAVLHLITEERLGFNGNWSQRLFWCVVAVAIIRSIAQRRLDVVGLAVAFTAWMTTLSWGAPTPALSAGACAVYLAEAIWRGVPPPPHAQRWLLPAGAVVAGLIVAVTSVHVRTRDDYGVLRGTESWTLGGALQGVRMDQTTATYLSDVRSCVAMHPARWTAVVPEGALAYAVYGLRNPFPIDWFWPPDYTGAGGRQRLIDAASTLDRRGNYLVLFQTASFGMPVKPGQIDSFVSDPPLASELASRLRHARRTDCHSFVAFYDPST
ncbi:MAG: hypothetical protein ACJ757_11980 [Gaiellaceae bacterium]